MKEIELRRHLKCDCCGNVINHSGIPIFWKVKVDRFMVDASAVNRQRGLGLFLGSQSLASVMGPDEDLAKSIMDPREITLCDECAVTRPIAVVLENG